MASNTCCGGTVKACQVEKVNCAETEEISAQETDQSCSGVRIKADWVTGFLQTPAGEVPQISTSLSFKDTL